MHLKPGSDWAQRFSILHLLGSGGAARVYLAIDRCFDSTQVAIKILHPHLAYNPLHRALFRNEFHLLKSISSNRIVKPINFDSANETLYFSMEYIDGETLHDFLKNNQLKFNELLEFAVQITEALGDIHRQKIVYRDLKSSNLMVDKYKQIKLIDLGISSLQDQKKGYPLPCEEVAVTVEISPNQIGNDENLINGSTHYLAPEIWKGYAAGPKTDLYSLGILFFEITTGILPFHGESDEQLMFKHCVEVPPNPTKLNSDIPRWFSDLTAKLLEKDPEKRPKSVDEIHLILNRKRGENTFNDRTFLPKEWGLKRNFAVSLISIKRHTMRFFFILLLFFIIIALLLFDPQSF